MIIDGVVEQGKRLGRKLGFPTANIAPGRVQGPWPENGVYTAAVWIDGERQARPGMLNQGVHPTVPEGKPTVEVHIIGFEGDIYGHPMRVEYLRFMRPERRFESLDALKTQMSADRVGILEWLDRARAGVEPGDGAARAREIDWRRDD